MERTRRISEDGHRGSRAVGGPSRRAVLLAGGATAGALWVAPSVITRDAAAASSSLASVVAGTFVHVQGNNATFTTGDMPVGTFTKLILVVAVVADQTGAVGPTAANTIGVSTAGWSPLVTVSDGATPGFAVFEAAGNAAPPTVTALNLKNGRYSATVLGWTNGTTSKISSVASAVAPATTLTVLATTATVPSTWVFAGSASDGFSTNNWAPLASPTWTPIVVPDIGGNNNTPPDMYVAQNASLLTTIPQLTESFFQTGSTGTDYGARGIFIGVG